MNHNELDELETEIVDNFHKSRRILEDIFWGDPDLRLRFNFEIDKLHNEQIVALDCDNSREWPDDRTQFLYWCCPDIIILAFSKISE